jgi:hypothetical protein
VTTKKSRLKVRVVGLISDKFNFGLGRSCLVSDYLILVDENTPASKSRASIDESRQIQRSKTVGKSTECCRSLSFT